jgi:hypothetical protein
MLRPNSTAEVWFDHRVSPGTADQLPESGKARMDICCLIECGGQTRGLSTDRNQLRVQIVIGFASRHPGEIFLQVQSW